MHDETVNNPQFPCFSGSSVVLVHSDTVIRASTYWSDQIDSPYPSFSVFFFIQSEVQFCMVQYSAVDVGAGQAKKNARQASCRT